MNLPTTLATITIAGLFAGGGAAVTNRPNIMPPVAAAQHAKPTKQEEKPDKQKADSPKRVQPKTHKKITVESGDSLAKIAKASDTTWQRMYYKNTKLSNPDLIYPGDKLVIPFKDEKLAKRPLPEKTSPVVSAQAEHSPPANSSVETATNTTSRRTPTTSPSPASSGSAWDRLAACESGGNWSINTGNGFYGGLQFTTSSWRAVGGSGLPSNASRAEQIMRAEKLQAVQGWGAWPVCSYKAGLR